MKGNAEREYIIIKQPTEYPASDFFLLWKNYGVFKSVFIERYKTYGFLMRRKMTYPISIISRYIIIYVRSIFGQFPQVGILHGKLQTPTIHSSTRRTNRKVEKC